MQILLFGKSGQVGWELQRSLAPLGELIALDVDSRQQCGDFTRLDDIAHTVRAIAPDVIVNAAAYTAVDKAESEPELVRTINALAPGILAREARKLGSWLIHYSTDYVFDGSGSKPWVETDSTGPLSVYGSTKLEGEEAIRSFRLSSSDLPHQLGVCGTWRQLRQDDATPCPGTRASHRRRRSDRRPHRC